MSFLLTVSRSPSSLGSMSIRSSRKKMVTFARASMVALVVGVGACKDPNPTFIFDASSDGAKDGASDGSSHGDSGGGDSGGAAGGGGGGGNGGTGGGAGTGGTGGSAGAGGAP